MRRLIVVLVWSVAAICWAQEGQSAPTAPPKSAPPRSDRAESPGYSSSKQTKIDLSAPGTQTNPLQETQPSGVNEMKPFNPHQADKDMEVGRYYFKAGNYCGALNRFYSALYYYSNYAEAAFRLGETYEKLGDNADARKSYQRYLDIWARGPLAEEAQKKLSELKSAPEGEVPNCGLIPPDATAGAPEEKPKPAGADLGSSNPK